jgi:signal transduction histidine kinase
MAGRATATMFTTTLPERAAIETRARGRGAAPPSPGAMVIAKSPSAATAEQLSMIIEQQHASAVTTAASSGTAMRIPSGGWRVLIQHAAGSLDAAVASARRRNLWLSFGILGVLVTSTFLVFLNARRSEKLAAQQMDFVATVSHELRTPVAVIRSAAQNLSAGVVHDAEQAKRYGDLIDTEGRRLTDMVEQVLEYAGLSGNRRPPASRPVDMASLVHDVVNTSHALPESRDIAFDIRVDELVPAVMADQDALRRAILNLVSNALKYADDGRWVGIAVTTTGARENGQVHVAVTDRGRGIPADDLAHIFEPFYRGRFAIAQQIHGNGLGLSLVKRIAEAHGGRVTVKSTPGQGSTFTIILPAASGAAAQIPQVDLA